MPTIIIKANAVTPLWTGNAWGTYKRIQPQSILGSLRFWLEVLCYASYIQVKSYKEEKVNYNDFKDEVLKNTVKDEENNGTIFEVKKKALQNLGISLPSQIFGCNGWKGFVKIKRIEPSNIKRNNPLNLRGEIIKNYDDKRKPAKWYYAKPYFWGDFNLEFELESNELKETIIYPLLHFIERYGFLGGKNNLGYGRVRFKTEEGSLTGYKTLKFKGYPDINFCRIVNENIIDFNDLLEKGLVQNRQIGLYIKEKNKKSNYKKIIEELILYKSDKRVERQNDKERHYIFGSTKSDEYHDIKGPNATKVIPWIDEIANVTYRYGYISLILLQGFSREVD